MNQQVDILQFDLLGTLEELVRLYRALLETVRQEKEILVASQLDDLNENNRAKEAILVKIQVVNEQREVQAVKLAQALNIKEQDARLLELARHAKGEASDRLRNFHSVLEILLKRVQELNAENELLVKSALQHITGAMKAIRDDLGEKPTYQRKGEVNAPAATGQLVSREA